MRVVSVIKDPHRFSKSHSSKIPKSVGGFVLDNMKSTLHTKKRYNPYTNIKSVKEKNDIRKFRKQMKELTLDDERIMIREHEREQVKAPRAMMIMYNITCWTMDLIYKDKPIDRFWMLETVARQPYFSYVTMLHIYETLGWWGIDGELRKQHAEQEYNETLHLQIMESMGADRLWWNRFLARHLSIAYFVTLIIFYLFSPRMAYLSSELLERHAVDTYDQFCEENETVLKGMQCTESALFYNNNAINMYDIFKEISKDENNHADNMEIIKELPN